MIRTLLAATLVSLILPLALPLSVSGQTDDEEFTQTTQAAKQDDPTRAIELFNQGQEAHSKGELEKALELYAEAIKLLPEFPEAEYQRGIIYETQDKFAEAEESFRRAMAYKQDWTLPMAALGNLLVSQQRFADARSVLEKAVSLDPMCIPCYPALTELYIDSNTSAPSLKRLLQKLSYLSSKAKIPPNIWAAKAAVERTLGDKTAARESLRRAFEIDPSDPSATAENVDLLIDEGDSAAALAEARKLTTLRPGSVAAKLRLANALAANEDVSAAITLLEAIPDPGERVLSAVKSLKILASQDPEELEKRLADSPNDVSALGRLCSLLRAKEPEKALDYCMRASRLEPKSIDHAVGYGAALLQLRRYREAAGLLEKLSKYAPENYTVRANLATALFQLGAFEQARDEYLWITRKRPDLAAGYYFLGICYDRLEYYTDAMASYQRFLRLADPGDYKEEIERVNLRMPILQRQIRNGKGKKS